MCENQMNSFEKNRPLVIPATEAYEITKSIVSDRVIEEIERINEEIKTAAGSGSYGITLDMLSSEAEELLEDAGYKVLRSLVRNDQSISIQWKEKFRDDQKRS